MRVYDIFQGNIYEKHLDKGSTWSGWANFGAALTDEDGAALQPRLLIGMARFAFTRLAEKAFSTKSIWTPVPAKPGQVGVILALVPCPK